MPSYSGGSIPIAGRLPATSSGGQPVWQAWAGVNSFVSFDGSCWSRTLSIAGTVAITSRQEEIKGCFLRGGGSVPATDHPQCPRRHGGHLYIPTSRMRVTVCTPESPPSQLVMVFRHPWLRWGGDQAGAAVLGFITARACHSIAWTKSWSAMTRRAYSSALRPGGKVVQEP